MWNCFEFTFANKYFVHNKKRNSLIIVTLIVLCASASALLFFFDLLGTYQEDYNIKAFGTIAEAKYEGVSCEDFIILKNNNLFEDLSYAESIRDVVVINGESQIISLGYYEMKAAEWSFASLKEGVWAEEPGYIVISDAYCKNIQMASLGDDVYLETLGKTYTVCGITKSDEEMVCLSQSDWYSSDLCKEGRGVIYLRFKPFEEAETWLRNVSVDIFNRDVNVYLNPIVFNDLNGGDFYTKLFIYFVVFLITFIAIYSIYYFTLIRDLKIYSSMKLLGLNTSQVKIIVRYQALYQCAISLTLGMVVSYIVNKLVFTWINNKVDMIIEAKQTLYDYIIVCLVIIAAVYVGTKRPIRILNKMSSVQAYHYNPVHNTICGGSRIYRFPTIMMAMRNIKRNKKRAILVGICMALVIGVFVLNANLIKSIFVYDDYLYESDYDFVIAGKLKLLELSKNQGVQQIMDQGYLGGWDYNEKGKCVDIVDKDLACDLKELCKDEAVTYYFSLETAIDDENYADRIEDAISRKTICEEQVYYYSLSKELSGIYQQQQYYVEFSEIEKCEVIEGELNRELFDTGKYTVLIYDEEIESDTLFHVGDTMILGGYSWFDAVRDSGNTASKSIDTIHDNQREVQVMAVVKNPPQLYNFAKGFNSCFVSLNEADVWNDNMIMLYAITIESNNIERTEISVNSIIRTYNTYGGSDISYLSEAEKDKQKQSDIFIYKVIGIGISVVLGIVAFLNLINNVMMSIIERKKELSTLHALGMTKSRITTMLRIENGVIVGTGCILGYVLGMLFSRVYSLLIYGKYVGFSEHFSYNIWPGLILMICITILSCIYPNKRTFDY